uniref:Enoyl-CoA hydratase/isomerase family protein n=1 Tax=Salmonella phage vB_Si_CECAV_FGS009 TaxID=3126494 RepID=A0AAU6PXM4_9CAUD
MLTNFQASSNFARVLVSPTKLNALECDLGRFNAILELFTA